MPTGSMEPTKRLEDLSGTHRNRSLGPSWHHVWTSVQSEALRFGVVGTMLEVLLGVLL